MKKGNHPAAGAGVLNGALQVGDRPVLLLHRRVQLVLRLHLPRDPVELLRLVVERLRRADAGAHRRELELELLLELLDVGGERLNRLRLRAQHALVVALQRLGRPQVELLQLALAACASPLAHAS